MSKLYVFIIVFVISVFQIQAQNSDVYLTLKNNQQFFEVHTASYYLEDASAKLTLQQLLLPENQQKFLKTKKIAPTFTNTNSIIWFRVKIENQCNNTQWVLENARAFTDSISLFVLNDSNQVVATKHTGLMVAFSQRDFKTNYHLFNIQIPQNAKYSYYFRIKSNKSIQFPLTISTYKQSFEDIAGERIAQGLFFGFAMLIILYNLFLYFSIRERLFIFYVSYSFCALLQHATQQGFVHEYITANIPAINYYGTMMFLFAPVAYALFCIEMLNLKQYPKLKLVQYTFIGISVLFFILSTTHLMPLIVLSKLLRVTIFSQVIITFFIAIWLVYQGYKPAKVFLLAASGFIAGVLITIIKELNLIPYNAFTNYASQMGSAWEMLMLSFAVGAKINQFRNEKKLAEAKAHQATVENARLVQEQNQILEQKVTERTARLVEANEELHQQQEELISINDALAQQKEIIQEQKEQMEITFSQLKITSARLDSSISYARQIQQVILPDHAEILNFFSSYFTIYLPKDIVSGDFYWFIDLGVQKNERNEISENSISSKDLDILEAISQKIIFDFEDVKPAKPAINNKQQATIQKTIQKSLFVLADCTGHGVSGAFMSMIGHTLLHEIIDYGKITDPAKILRALDKAITNVLRQKEGKNSDGMDISVCLFEKNLETQEVAMTFAGAKTVIYCSIDKKLQRLNGNKSFIGGLSKKEKEFTNQIINLHQDDIIYCLSDGYADQNNENRQSIGTAILTNLFQEIQELPMEEQQKLLSQFLAQHQGKEQQRDDITVVGLKI